VPHKRLSGLRIGRVALVPAGANFDPETGDGAHILLAKSALDKQSPDLGDMSPAETASHLPAKHGVAVGNVKNPKTLFAAHAKAHSDGTYAKGQEHDHASKGIAKADLYGDEDYVAKKDYSTDQRVEMAKKGQAIPVRNDKGEIVDGRYPIGDGADLSNAIAAFGRGSPADKPTIKAHIIKNAKRLGLSDKIPEDWSKAAVSKVGRKISASRRGRLSAALAAAGEAHKTIEEILSEGEPTPAPEVEPTGKGTAMTGERKKPELPAFDKSALSPEAKAHVEKLEALIEDAYKPADAPADPTAELLKGADPAIRKAFELQAAETKKAREEAQRAQKAADDEIEKRETADWVRKVDFGYVPGLKPEEFGPKLRALAKTDPETAEAVRAALSGANEALESASIFDELGKDRLGNEATALGQIEVLAKARFEAIKKTAEGASYTIEQARADVAADPANAELIGRERAERVGR
jgi:hypothetical protein